MRILLVTQYFWPEPFIISEIVRKLAAFGHHVTVLTGKPNYPDGKIFPGYTKKGVMREAYCQNADIIRVPLRPRNKNRSLDLLLNYLSFVWSGLFRFRRQIRHEQFDLVFALQLSPITSVIPAIYLSRRLRIPLIAWIQDLWPESLLATGHIKNRFLLWLVGRLVSWIYNQCDLILVQSHAFTGHVQKYARKSSRIEYYSNSINIDGTPDKKKSKALGRKLDTIFKGTKFYLLFAGNIGIAQDVETLFEAAIRLKDSPRFCLVFVGSGSMIPWLERRIKETGITNILLAGRHPPEDMPAFFERADALLVSLKKADIFALTVPTKIQSYLFAARPIIGSLDGEGARIIKESGAGITCAPENPAALAEAIGHCMALSPAVRRKMGVSGKKHFIEHYEMNRQVKKLSTMLSEFLRERNGSPCQ
jgi:glycosyltransferase involved in cell wall biosynthesis